MFVAYLAGSAGKVIIPEAIEVVPSGADDQLSFIDAQGRALVTFRRQDLALYSKDADPFGDLLEHDGLEAGLNP
jgi:hypothetical protein